MFGLGMPELDCYPSHHRYYFGAGKLPEIGSGIGKGNQKILRNATKKEEAKTLDEDTKGDSQT